MENAMKGPAESAFFFLARAIDEARELVAAFVEGFKADGFTDEQARALAVAFLTHGGDNEEE